MATTKRGKAIRERDHALRDSLFPGAAARRWDRSAYHGFATIPKTMPYICRILDELSKGAPLASTYLALWCATWDDAFVKLGRSPGLSFAAGFSGQRGVRTFNDRVKKLGELGFVEIEPLGAQPLGLVFLPNPHLLIMRLYAARLDATAEPAQRELGKLIQAATYNAFIERAQEVDCTDVKAELREQQRDAAPPTGAAVAKPPARTRRRRATAMASPAGKRGAGR